MSLESNPFAKLFDSYEDALNESTLARDQLLKRERVEKAAGLKSRQDSLFERIFLFSFNKASTTPSILNLSHLVDLVTTSQHYNLDFLNFLLYERLSLDPTTPATTKPTTTTPATTTSIPTTPTTTTPIKPTTTTPTTTTPTTTTPATLAKEVTEGNALRYLGDCFLRIYPFINNQCFQSLDDFLNYEKAKEEGKTPKSETENETIQEFLYNCFHAIRAQSILRLENPELFIATDPKIYFKDILIDNNFISSADIDLHKRFMSMLMDHIYHEAEKNHANNNNNNHNNNNNNTNNNNTNNNNTNNNNTNNNNTNNNNDETASSIDDNLSNDNSSGNENTNDDNSDCNPQPTNPPTNPLTTNQPTTSQPSTNQPSTNQPLAKQPSTNQPTNQPLVNQPTTNQPSTDQPPINQPFTNPLSTNPPNQPTNQPSTNQPTTNQTTTNQPSTNQPPTLFPIPMSCLHTTHLIFQPILEDIHVRLKSAKLNDPSLTNVFDALQFFASAHYNHHNNNLLAMVLLHHNNKDIEKERHRSTQTSTFMPPNLGFLYGDSIIGRLLSISCIPQSDFSPCSFFTNTNLLDAAYVERMDAFIHSSFDNLHDHIHHLIVALLKLGGVVKHGVLGYMAGAIMHNKDRSKTWTMEQTSILPTTLASDAFILNLSSILLRLFKPIMTCEEKMMKIQLDYCDDTMCAGDDDDADDARMDIHLRNIKETRLIPKPTTTTPATTATNTTTTTPATTATDTSTTTPATTATDTTTITQATTATDTTSTTQDTTATDTTTTTQDTTATNTTSTTQDTTATNTTSTTQDTTATNTTSTTQDTTAKNTTSTTQDTTVTNAVTNYTTTTLSTNTTALTDTSTTTSTTDATCEISSQQQPLQQQQQPTQQPHSTQQLPTQQPIQNNQQQHQLQQQIQQSQQNVSPPQTPSSSNHQINPSEQNLQHQQNHSEQYPQQQNPQQQNHSQQNLQPQQNPHHQPTTQTFKLHPQRHHKTPPYTLATECFFLAHSCISIGFNVALVKFNQINERVSKIMARYKEVVAGLGVNSLEGIQLKEDLQRVTPLFYCYKSLLTHPSSLSMAILLHSSTANLLTTIITKRGGGGDGGLNMVNGAGGGSSGGGGGSGGLNMVNGGGGSNLDGSSVVNGTNDSNDDAATNNNGKNGKNTTKNNIKFTTNNKTNNNNIANNNPNYMKTTTNNSIETTCNSTNNNLNNNTNNNNINNNNTNSNNPNNNNTNNNSHNKINLEDFESSPALQSIPEFVVENIQKYMFFIKKFQVDVFERHPDQISNIFLFTTIFCSSPDFINNPHLRAELVLVFSSLLPHEADTHDQFNHSFTTFHRRNLFSHHPCSHLLSTVLTSLYVDTEATSQEGQFETKFQLRLPIYSVIKFMCHYPLHQLSIKELATYAEEHADDTNVPVFLRFVNLLINDAIHLLDEALSLMAQIKELEASMEGEEWRSLPQHRRRQTQVMHEHMTKLARFHNILAMATISCLSNITTDSKNFFCQPVMVDRLASMLNYFLLHLVGPKKQNLLVKDRSKQAFEPKMLVREICAVYENLAIHPDFLKAISRDGRSYSRDLFSKAEAVMTRMNESPHRINNFNQIASKIREYADEQQEDEDNLSNIPDEFLDPIMGHLMTNPVRLPSSGVVVDRTTIARHLLSDQTDPFNRQALTMHMVGNDDGLMEQIKEWLRMNKMKSRKNGDDDDDVAGEKEGDDDDRKDGVDADVGVDAENKREDGLMEVDEEKEDNDGETDVKRKKEAE